MSEKTPPIQATKMMKKLMADHFLALDRAAAEGSPKVAWCTSVGPAELLIAMGFEVYYPENHGAMLGASRMATDTIPVANALGYSPEICSYLTADVGAFLKGITPLTRAYGIKGVPKPDVLVFNTNQCRDVQDWFEWYGRHFDVPAIGVRTHRGVGEVRDYMVADVAQQIQDLIPTLEKVSGNKFDIDRLREVVGLSKQCTEQWRGVLEYGARVPAQLNFFDHTIHMAPAVVLRGRPEAIEYYDTLLAELVEREKMGYSAVPGERMRLYWDGMPVWGRLRMLSELMTELKAAIVCSTYCNSWIFGAFDANDPFESMARAYTELFIVRDEAYKEAYMKEHIERYGCQGVIFHDAKTCPNNSNSRYGLPQRFAEVHGVPSLVINGDLNDLRCFSDEQAKTNLEAFVEQIEEAAA
ncbi:MAG: 2-hydroxyacyl-CoA dehydratase family protein [Desulfarculaceae bacterium]|nr:2-hydroxyacyl-CoA dehydratase family protein [Desulfarculaceae bacterium]MCF8048175.1 2-hydroxyacyl-CoA dehydratase family protein [Desulfarculaceae bacterium]MCF8065606.1 2-hydroxyacyl-CoA dehydratase family protein [Desulfarculaceae bacterium]MCF8096406.1 2-hydroxyacyl-CoA dehydratase family protein [Desulfarculaceae bacterium]MCF8121915.1 2-hydroxyacyl-CoA dehydratase family protein [Desulfarculaceae bacterium]